MFLAHCMGARASRPHAAMRPITGAQASRHRPPRAGRTPALHSNRRGRWI